MRERIVQSFRVNPKLWKSFKNAVTQSGFSTCFILETLIRAYLTGTDTPKKVNKSSSITVNQNIVYEVAKSRRRRGVRFVENCYQNGMWTYRPVEKGEKLSPLGHVTECRCSVCKPRQTKQPKRSKLQAIAQK